MTEPTYIDVAQDTGGGRTTRQKMTKRVWVSGLGSKIWFQDGVLHREDGPAVERFNGDKEWYLNGERHREDGPAIEWADGDKEWYLNDKLIGKGERPENWNEIVLLAQVKQVMND